MREGDKVINCDVSAMPLQYDGSWSCAVGHLLDERVVVKDVTDVTAHLLDERRLDAKSGRALKEHGDRNRVAALERRAQLRFECAPLRCLLGHP